MASVPPEKRRKKYLHKDAVFEIPSSTKHRWEQRESTDKTNTSPFVNGASCSSSVDRRACANEAAGSADSVPCVGEASCSTATTDFFEVTDIGRGIGADSGEPDDRNCTSDGSRPGGPGESHCSLSKTIDEAGDSDEGGPESPSESHCSLSKTIDEAGDSDEGGPESPSESPSILTETTGGSKCASPSSSDTINDVLDGFDFNCPDLEVGSDPEGGSPAPPYDEASLLSDCFAQYGDSTMPHSTTTKTEMIAMIMAFLASFNLPWTALEFLLLMLNKSYGPGSDVLPKSKYLFRKLWAAKSNKLVKHHYYCPTCGSLLKEVSENDIDRECPSCNISQNLDKARRDGCFFTMLSFRDQVSQVISQTKATLHDNLKKLKEQAEEPSEIVRDITSAAAYKKLRESDVLNWSDLTVTFNTDGSPLYKSSKSSVWPIQFTINELPPRARFEHCVLAGLWFGSSHPNMALFLEKFVEEVNALDSLTWHHNSSTISSKVYALCCCVDAPARAEVRNHSHFNGYFGCPWCLASGEHLEGCVRYRGTLPDEERTPQGVRRDMELATLTGRPVNGVKGPSPLARLPHFDLVWGFSADYMHSVLLGVTRQFTDYLFNSTNCREDFYLGSPSIVATVNQRLLSIKPPHTMTRLPRPVGDRCFWKASEWRLWLLFYVLPCTLGILKQRYWKHLRSLVEAIHMLLSEELTPRMLETAGGLLRKFVGRVEPLYKKGACMTFNVHQLLHLPKAAEQLGPLWAHSAFVFEGGNGEIVKSVTSAKGVPLQIVERVVLLQELQQLLNHIPLSSTTRQACEDMLGYKRVEKCYEFNGASMLGTPKPVARLTFEEQAALDEVGIHLPYSVVEYKRFILDKHVYHSQQYTRTKKRDSTMIITKSGCGGGRCCGGRRGGGFDGGGCGSRCGGTVFGRPGWLNGGQGSGSQEVRAACPQGLDRCRHVVREGLCLQQVSMESTCFVGFQMYYGDPAQPAGVRRSQDPWRRRLRVATEREWDLVVGLARRWSGLMFPTPGGNEVDRPSFLPRRPRVHGVAGGPTPGRSPGRRRTRSVVRGLRRGRPCLVPRCCCGRPCPVPRRPAGCRARGTCGARAALARSAVRPSPVLTPPWAAAPRVWSTGSLGSSRPGAWPLRWASWDVLLQIKEDILDRISCTTTRAVLALDIKGAFDNVSHTLVFENLASTGCGPRMYDYVRDFLSNWMATIGIESIRTSTIPIPSKGNRQGSVLSPTFGRQDFLEEVIETVQNYLEAGNLQRAPDKSQLLLLRAGKPIPEEEEGGHPPHRDGGAKYTVDRLVKTTTQVMRMVRRITSHRHGLEESDLIRLTQPLVVSHIACANPYLNLLSRGKGKMDVIIRKGY
ncbi:hypothetical protein ISCGN_027832 [Ixodes scapularis]